MNLPKKTMTASLVMLLGFSTPLLATPFDFQFGISPEITVRANERVLIGAAIVNRGTDTLNFGCARVSCGGLDFGAGVSDGSGEGLNALNFMFLEPRGDSFYSQFAGITLVAGERFDFLFGTIYFDPSNPIGNPLGTVLHPTFSFRFGADIALVTSTVSVGTDAVFSPFKFSDGNAPTTLPVPSSLLLIGSGLVGLGFSKRRRTG